MTDPHRGLRVLVLGASLRRESLNMRLATLAAQVTQAGGAVADLVDLSAFDVPLYNHDILTTEGIPAGARRFGDRLIDTDGFIIASPEYNYSIPGVLKNLIDWTSRIKPWPFTGRHGLLMSASPMLVGGNRGLWALRIPLEGLGARLYPDMFSMAQADTAFTASGEIADPAMRERFDRYINGFLDLTEAARHYPAAKRLLAAEPEPASASERLAASG